MYEYFKECIDYLDKPFVRLFNYILDKRTFPASWSKGVIIPVYKKGDHFDPTNYRGITLTTCFSKLFTSVLNERIKAWTVGYDVLSDAQFGFKANYGTVDAIFTLNSFIQRQLGENKKLYCCFVDLQKCFDSIYRNGLWYKLIKYNVSGKLFNVIRSLYNDVKLCVKHMNSISDLFDYNVGLLQGESLSPILFSLFVNDIELFLQQNTNECFTLGQLSIYLLLFADDSVLISDTPTGLQQFLLAFKKYCEKWNLKVNVQKTKIVIFRRGRTLTEEINFTYSGNVIEKVNTFNYLGLVFTNNGSFQNALKTLAGKAARAMSYLLQITRHKEIPLKIMINLFDSFVASILYYSSEVWGFMTSEVIERLHRKFLRKLLNVKTTTSNSGIYGEFGRFPLHINIKCRKVKYFIKLFIDKKENCILQTVMIELDKAHNTNLWTNKVKALLQRTGFYDIWLFPASVNLKIFLPIFRNRLIDIYVSEWFQDINNRPSLFVYMHLKENFNRTNYLNKMTITTYRNAVAKLRLSAHNLFIEIGRHRNIVRNERICSLCTLNEVEDEYHFLLICPAYNELRHLYLKKYYYNNPSMLKLIQLLNCENVKVLNGIGIFYIKVNEMRKNELSIVSY